MTIKSYLLLLQHHDYLFVSRTGRCFNKDFHWVYWCSCDKPRAHLLNSLSPVLELEYTEFCKTIPSKCIHILALQEILSTSDDVPSVFPEQDLSGTLAVFMVIEPAVCFIDHWYGSRESFHGPEVIMNN